MMHLRISNRQWKNLDDVYEVSKCIARHFPQPDEFVTAIHELLLNAIEHGNLEIGFEEKARLLRQGLWQDEIARRLITPPYHDKEVRISVTQDAEECRLMIADQGKGFSWEKYAGRLVGPDHLNGRGLWIAFNSKFDRIAFNRLGNEVTCTAYVCLPILPENRNGMPS